MKQIQCPDCEGSGHIIIGENFVTHEMAIDAGDLQLEGQSLGAETVRCQRCDGRGWIEAETSSTIQEQGDKS